MRQLNLKLDSAEKYEITPQGFLKCNACVTRCGIFEYNENGKPIFEYRPDTEVFDEDSMNSLAMIPITKEHPSSLINTDNVKELQVGYTGEQVDREDDFLKCAVVITDKNLINEILKKHKENIPNELSCGYDCELEESSGLFDGKPYDRIQRNIRYNHLAIVDEARAGKEASLRLDSKEDKITEIRYIKNDDVIPPIPSGFMTPIPLANVLIGGGLVASALFGKSLLKKIFKSKSNVKKIEPKNIEPKKYKRKYMANGKWQYEY